MDIQRIIIIMAIAVVSYLLLMEWQGFSQKPVIENIASKQSSATTGTLPNLDLAPKTDQSDLPVLKPAQDIEQLNVDSRELIKIRTDVLEIHIDPVGGDIVYTALLQQLKSIDSNEPFVLLQQGNVHNYIAQSGLIGKNGTDSSAGRPVFSSQSNSYILQDSAQSLTVELSHQQDNGAQIIKRFQFNRGDYLINADYIINNNSDSVWSAHLYGQLKRDSYPDPSADSGNGLGVQPFLGVATSTPEKRFYKIAFDDIEEEKFKTEKQGGWIAIIQHYYLSAWIPENQSSYSYNALQNKDGDNIARFLGPEISLDPQTETTINSRFYVGPKDQYRLETVADGLDLSVDYGWLWWIAQPLFWFLNICFGWTQNWGFAIILLTIAVKAIFFYPSAMAYKSMAKMRKIQPKMVALREQYPDDRQKQSQEMMALYKKEGVNPLGGCLPILVQMPVFISLYWVLLESVELRHAPFIGYIHDLSAMDPYFIMPLIMGASMFIQQKLNPPPPDPMQAKIMTWMPVFFTVFFLWFPAGLVLYWVVNNILSIIQQWAITRQIEREG